MKFLPLLIFLLACTADASGNDGADRLWARVETLRKGPGVPPADAPEEAVRTARGHLAAQEQTLAEFITRFPDDSRRHEAELEYTAVMSTLGASLSDRMRIDRALQRLVAMERAAGTPSKFKADAAFQRITITMQTVNIAASGRPGEAAGARNTILESAQNFAVRFPEDRRSARLLAEAATLLDDQPSRKRRVLEEAQSLARDEATRQRIADDLRRLSLLGEVPDLTFKTVQGGEFDLAAQQGRIVVLVFWASWSPPSILWLSQFSKFARSLPGNRVVIATVSLDRKRDHCRETLKALGIESWPTGFDGGGWDNATARKFAINALPTMFVFDREGRLRTQNARDTYESALRQLLSGKD